MSDTKNTTLPHVAVIIVSYNTASLTQRSVDAVLKSEGIRASIYIVDNCSTDRTVTQLRRKFALRSNKNRWLEWQEKLHTIQATTLFSSVRVDVTAVPRIYEASHGDHTVFLLPSDHNLGFGRANNLATAGTDAEYVFFLNSDAFVGPKTIKNMVKQFQRRPTASTSVLARMRQKIDNLGILAAELRNEDGSFQLQGGSLPTNTNVFLWATFLDDLPLFDRLPSYQHHMHDMKRYHRRPIAKVGWVGGTAMMVSRPCLDEIGGFDSEIFMYGEDVDLCWRATLRHWDVAMTSKARVVHLGSASAGHKAAILGEIRGLLYMWQKHRSVMDFWTLRQILKIGLVLRIIIFGILRRYGQQRTYQEALELVR